jgi:type II secretory pathway pseudopilin PulG
VTPAHRAILNPQSAILNSSRRAFTLTEVLIVTGLSAMLCAGVVTFYVQSLRTSHASEQELKLITAMRRLTSELVFNGSRSHELILYASVASEDVTPERRLVVSNDDTESLADDLCPTGDFVVFVTYELPKPAAQPRYRIAKLTGYYLESVDSGPPALIRLTIDLADAPSTATVETILADHWETAERTTVAPRVTPLALADGAAADDVPHLFYRRANQSIAVCGQLLASSVGRDTGDSQSHTRTFFFAVTVRS